MKKLLPVVILAIPTAIIFLSMKLGINYVVSTSTDFTRIGERIKNAIPTILMVNHFILFVLAFVTLKFQKIRIYEMGLVRPLRFAFLGVLLGLLLFAVQILITLPLLYKLKLFEYWNGFPGFDFLLSATLFAGVVEELIFRGYGSLILQRYGYKPTTVRLITTAAFAAIHYGQGLPGVINAIVMGSILIFTFQRVRSLPLVISGHVFANLIFILFMTFRSPAHS